jgi:hypothetical protein
MTDMEVMMMKVEETEKHYIMKVGSMYVDAYDYTHAFGLGFIMLTKYRDSAKKFYDDGHPIPTRVMELFRVLQKEGMRDITIASIEEKFVKEETEYLLHENNVGGVDAIDKDLLGTDDAGTIVTGIISITDLNGDDNG